MLYFIIQCFNCPAYDGLHSVKNICFLLTPYFGRGKNTTSNTNRQIQSTFSQSKYTQS